MVNIGTVGTYSGVIGAVDQNSAVPVQVWADYANACGGLDGHQVKLFTADDGGDPSTAVSETQQMVQTDHVIAFVGDFAVLTGPAEDAYLEQNKIPEIGGDGVSTVYYADNMWFPVTTDFNDLGLAALGAAKKAGTTKLAVFYCVELPTLCGATATVVENNATAQGMTDVLNAPVSLTQPSFAAQCSQAQSAGANVIFSLVDSAGQVREADNCATAANFHPSYISISLSANSDQPSDANLQGLFITVGSFPWTDNTTPAEKTFQAQTVKYAPSELLNATSSADWASGILAMQAAAGNLSASNPTSAQILKGLYSIKNNTLGGLTAPLTFTNNGQPPTKISCYFAAQVENKKWTAPFGDTLQCP
ncbi:MAG TPA: ABC transporter substrate-binding protein [Acidimicrobiales bacterium]|nr:ABC transporter substrate-binding protein [Acidimicrobiales bacterium]